MVNIIRNRNHNLKHNSLTSVLIQVSCCLYINKLFAVIVNWLAKNTNIQRDSNVTYSTRLFIHLFDGTRSAVVMSPIFCYKFTKKETI